MKQLFYLYLSDNDLTSLDPAAFAGLSELTYLHLEGNRLTQLPGAGETGFVSVKIEHSVKVKIQNTMLLCVFL